MSIRDAFLSGSIAIRQHQQPPGSLGAPHSVFIHCSHLLLPWISLQALTLTLSLTWQLPGRVKLPWGLELPANQARTHGITAATFTRVHLAEPHGSAALPRASTQRQTWTHLLFRVVNAWCGFVCWTWATREKAFQWQARKISSKGILLLSYSK